MNKRMSWLVSKRMSWLVSKRMSWLVSKQDVDIDRAKQELRQEEHTASFGGV